MRLVRIILVMMFTSTLMMAQEQVVPKVKWGITSQVWFRYSELNSGTTINGESTKNFADVSFRRLRIPVSSQLTPKLLAYAMFGGNNYNSKSSNFPVLVLDLYAEYALDKSFEVGIGKSGWQGLSRWNVRSTKTLMGLDAPLFVLNTVNKTDDLARNLSVWLKGQADKFDYRLVFSSPKMVSYAAGKSPVDLGKTNFAHNTRPRVKVSTYVKYQFLEEESNKSAYAVGTYINKKRVFNIGAGAQYQEKALTDGTDFYDMNHWAVDSFLSLPLGNDDGITAYLGYYDFDYGKDYVRNVGANGSMFDSGSGDTYSGGGVAFPLMGTGNTVYSQFGYAFKVGSTILQPNLSVQYSQWDALTDAMIVYDSTVNVYLGGKGHSNKISLGYQLRPVFDKLSTKEIDKKRMFVLQYQVSLK